MDGDVVLLLRFASIALPALAAAVFTGRYAMIAHEEKRRDGGDDSDLGIRDNWTLIRLAWRRQAGRRAVLGALASTVLAMVAFLAWRPA